MILDCQCLQHWHRSHKYLREPVFASPLMPFYGSKISCAKTDRLQTFSHPVIFLPMYLHCNTDTALCPACSHPLFLCCSMSCISQPISIFMLPLPLFSLGKVKLQPKSGNKLKVRRGVLHPWDNRNNTW